MTERMKTFLYCAITAVVTTIVVSVGRPQTAQAQLFSPKQHQAMTITHVITFGLGADQFGNKGNTLIIKKQ